VLGTGWLVCAPPNAAAHLCMSASQVIASST
jgi:hypothetical protein